MHKTMNLTGVNKKRLGFFLLAGLLLALALVFLPAVKDGAKADTTANGFIQGWLWSANVGWLNADQSRVSIADDGKVNGYVWSPSLGWLRLDPATSSSDTYPSSPNHGVQVDSSKTSMSGWARFCNVYQDPNKCSGSLKAINGPELGGWDGWVKLINVTKNSSGNLSGYAWGGLNLGWMTFGSGSGSGCTLQPVDVSCNATPVWCDPCKGTCTRDCGGGPTVSCTATPNSGISVNDSVEYEAFVSDNSGYSYVWSGDNGALPFPVPGTKTFTTSYGAEGTYHVAVNIKNSGGKDLGTADCNGSVGVIVGECTGEGIRPIDNGNRSCCTGLVLDNTTGTCEKPPVTCAIVKTGTGSRISYYQYQSDNDKYALTIKARIEGCSAPSDIVSAGLPSGFELICNEGSCSGLGNNDYVLGVKWADPTVPLPKVADRNNPLSISFGSSALTGLMFDYYLTSQN